MKNFNLNKLTDFDVKEFSEAAIRRYVSPIKAIIKRNRLPLKELECYDNASMLRVDLGATEYDVKLEKCVGAFDSLRSQYQKMYSKVNGERISIYIPKEDADRQILSLKHLLESEDYHDYISTGKRELPFVLGETVENQVIIEDLTELPHLLIAGASGSGKSVALHSVINSLLYYLPPEELQFVLFDMKMVELAFYDRLPHLAFPICIESDEAPQILENIISEMTRRLNIMKRARVLTLSRYNKLPNVIKIPYLVVIIDEFADLILSNKSVEKTISTIAQKGRAAGIHLILSTQRPDATVLTGQIKANIQARVALTVSNHYDSQIILDESGAELLNRKGDMIYKNGDGVFRLQGSYLTEKDIDTIVTSICEKHGTNNFYEEIEEYTQEEETQGAFTQPLEYVKRLVDGDTKDGQMVLLDEFYHTCTAVIERGVASKTFIKKLWNCGEKKAYKYINRMQSLNIIGEYNQLEYSYPILVDLDTFNEKFISVGVANG